MTTLYLYRMTGQLNFPPYQSVYWTVYNTPDFSGAQSGYPGQLQNIVIDYTQTIPNTDFNSPSGPAFGDLSGNYPNPIVVGFNGIPIDTTVAPTTGQVYALNSDGYWTATDVGGGGGTPTGPAGGDLSGTYPNPTVSTVLSGQTPLTTTSGSGGDLAGTFGSLTLEAINSYPITVSFPNFGDVLWWNGSEWVNDNTIYSTLTALQAQVANLSNGLGFALPVSGPNVPNVYFDGTTLSTVTT